ncbi:hypothetical protein HJC23_002346 [Cyclotella cryptica]|uniref:DUF7495 domain-containing protein n=1 Tax=Cyclotella cryptica TaxID=29204 RepID=A0ABD3QKR1_9STRA|eukprot:CCRYP_004445-RA/>CCRYP_004445-RA protein AED:0.06 eAED:0.06 QI:223/1/1/1/1/1/4/301/1061
MTQDDIESSLHTNGPTDLLDALPEDTEATPTYNHRSSQISALGTSDEDLHTSGPYVRNSEGEGEDGDDEDDEEEAMIHDDMIMAKRTSQLMNDFRSYISEIQSREEETKMPTVDERGDETTGVDYEQEGMVGVDGAVTVSEGVGNGSALMRGWSYGDDGVSQKQQEPYRDNPFDVNAGYGDIHDDVVLSRRRYHSRPYSKKLKRCLIGSVVSVVLISIIAGSISSANKARKEKSLPDWEAELAQVQAEQEAAKTSGTQGQVPQHNEEQPHMPQVGEPLQKPEMGSGSSQTATSTKEETAKEILDFAVKNPDTEAYKTVKAIYKPVWFGRQTGWLGTTYDEGLLFCATQRDSDNKSMVPCPYPAYCPEGRNNIPYGGVKDEAGTWAPILDTVNDWVDVGSGENNCRLYSDMNSEPPAWGITGGKEEWTDHILCCKSMYDQDNSATASQDTVATAAATTQAQATEKAIPPEPTPKPQQTEDPIDVSVASEEYAYAEAYRPVWYDRNSGWNGQSYLAAGSFCAEQNAMLCPYEVYCPTGPNHLPYGGVRPDAISWAPISDSKNGWVSVSEQNTCVRYSILNLIAPHWGLTGEGNEEITRHLLCCQDPSSIFTADDQDPTAFVSDGSQDAAGISVNDSSTGSTQIPAEAPDSSQSFSPDAYLYTDDQSNVGDSSEATSGQQEMIYEYMAQQFKPIAFTRDQGWDGHTYSSAIKFCATKGSKIPCPYEVICPMGPSGMPIEGKRGGSYSPIINAPNGWASMDSCDLYSHANPYPPLWGLTGENNEEFTNTVVCCDESDDRTQNTAEPGETPNETEQSILDEFKPVWFGRDQGYSGTTYDDAQVFCENVAGMELCPLDAYCPNGNDPSNENPLFLNRAAFDSEQWAPYANNGKQNSYVLVGKSSDYPNPCLTYEQLHGRTPEWESGSVELKKVVMCCMSHESLGQEESVVSTVNPKWMSNSDGWTGGSHEDATAFCQTQSKSLCPLVAYCPWGESSPPLGGHSVDFVDEQWAPVYGEDNNWVLIGRKYNNIATTCMTHMDLEGNAPDWGLTSDYANAKRHILCCSLS